MEIPVATATTRAPEGTAERGRQGRLVMRAYIHPPRRVPPAAGLITEVAQNGPTAARARPPEARKALAGAGRLGFLPLEGDLGYPLDMFRYLGAGIATRAGHGTVPSAPAVKINHADGVRGHAAVTPRMRRTRRSVPVVAMARSRVSRSTRRRSDSR